MVGTRFYHVRITLHVILTLGRNGIRHHFFSRRYSITGTSAISGSGFQRQRGMKTNGGGKDDSLGKSLQGEHD